MNFLSALETSASGLSAQRTRMNLISGNLANINTTRTTEGGPYRRKEAVFSSVPIDHSFYDQLNMAFEKSVSQVEVASIIEDEKSPITKFDPQHPDADKDGYVELPNINVIEEMVNMMMASRSYEANVAAFNATKKMALKALEIGK